MRLTFANLWVVIYALGIAWHAQPLVIVPAVFAILAANGVRSWSVRASRYRYTGGARQIQRVVVGAMLVAAIAGLAGASTALAVSYDTEDVHLRDAPFAMFFLVAAILAWRALVRPGPRRTATLAFFVYAAWLPVLVWNSIQALGDVPQAIDWQHSATRVALWSLLGGGALVCWAATLARPEGETATATARIHR